MPFSFEAIERLLLVRMFSAFVAAFAHRLVVLGLAVATASGFFPAPVDFVHGRPRTALSFLVGYATALVSFLDVLLLPLLFVSVFGFVSAWHLILLDDPGQVVQTAYRYRSKVASEWHLGGSSYI
jgi:hypothetical protein